MIVLEASRLWHREANDLPGESGLERITAMDVTTILTLNLNPTELERDQVEDAMLLTGSKRHA